MAGGIAGGVGCGPRALSGAPHARVAATSRRARHSDDDTAGRWGGLTAVMETKGAHIRKD